MKQYKYKINGNLYNVTVNDVEDNIARVEVNGIPFNVEMEKKAKAEAPKPVVRPVAKPVSKPVAPATTQSGIKSPLPGVILDIKVKEGDEVKKGQTVVILEAMKMENSISSDRSGKVVAIKVSKGESVLEGTDLIIIE
ncbi:MAG: biotin/lipoyl-binding protein [Bacteroidaceae bacterium]|nr:biotin/lipoyl-binding protein [Bacteroidaceae bacterium]